MANEKTSSGALHYGRLKLVEHARQELCADIPAGCTMKDVLRPEFWKHYVNALVPGSIIECMCEDGAWEASLRVMFVSETGVETAVRWSQTYEAKDRPQESATHEIRWISPTKKWAVIHKESNKVVQDEFYPKKKAQQFMATL